MGVKFKVLTGEVPLATVFEDPFTTLGKAALREGWLLYRSSLPAASPTSDYARYDVGVNGLVWERQNGSASFNLAFSALMPLSLLNSEVYGQSQFVETQISAVSANAGGALITNFSGDMEVGVSISSGYALCPRAAAGVQTFRLIRLTAQPPVIIFNDLLTWAVNDIIRFECVQQGSQNTLNTLVNGVVVDTRIDADALRPIATGYPGIGVQFINTANNITFRSFEGGVLL